MSCHLEQPKVSRWPFCRGLSLHECGWACACARAFSRSHPCIQEEKKKKNSKRNLTSTMCCCKIILSSVTPSLQNNKSQILFRPLRQLLRALRQPPFCLLPSGFPLRGPNLLPLMTTGCRSTNYRPPHTHPTHLHGNPWPTPRTQKPSEI